MAKRNSEIKLIPYQVQAIQTNITTEIPFGLKMHHAPEIWNTGETGNGIVIAVLDTGIDTKHPDLKDNILDGRNFTNEGWSRNNIEDGNGHGTHVAGTICANGKIKGVAPDSKIIVGKVLNRFGSGDYRGIIEGVKWATNWKGKNGERCRIINMSLGGSHNDPHLEKAILDACAKGIMVVCASGNEGDGNDETFEFGYPALINETITVGACDKNRKMARFTNNHYQVDVTGAGVDILSTYPSGKYAVLSGTSMATPHVSGILALLIKLGEKKFKRGLTESEIYGLMTQCCCGLGNKASQEGHGLPELSRFFDHC
jgi:major intracellular serine protease